MAATTPRPTPRDLADFDVAVITVPTPLRDGAPDLSYIEDAARLLAAHLRAGACVILESTTYPGTTDELVAPHPRGGLGTRAPAPTSTSATRPERIDPGNPNAHARGHAEGRVGHRRRVARSGAGVLRRDRGCAPCRCRRTREAELTKLLENTFRHVNIALVNELAMFAADLGIDVWEAIDAAATKPFGFMRFDARPGRRRPLPPDRPELPRRGRSATQLGAPFRFVELANDINDHMPEYVVRRLGRRPPRPGPDHRRCPGAPPRARLQARDAATPARPRRCGSPNASPASAPRYAPRIRTWSTRSTGSIPPIGLVRVDLDPAEVAAADAVVVVTPHAAFDLEMVVANARYVLDTRRAVPDAPNVEHL